MQSTPLLNVHTKPKDPPYPLGTAVLVKLSYWKEFKAGVIIKHDKRPEWLRIPDPSGGDRILQELIIKDDYGFIPVGKTYPLRLDNSVEVKLADGTLWSRNYQWYSPEIHRDGRGLWVTTPVPENWPASLEEAIGME